LKGILDSSKREGGPPAGGPGSDRGRAPERQVAIRRAAYLALTLAAAGFSVRAVIGDRGILELHRSRVELARLETEVERWQRRNVFLEARIKALREDPATIEAIARERLDWVRPGEITFLLPYDAAAPEPGDPGPAAPDEFAVVAPGDTTR
jgi:cell division protein FtsB